jgi:diguanylate cyclase (GGDEF)-like protein
MLVAFARILESHSRNEDIACRQGGEEFVLIMPEMDTGTAQARAAEIMQSMAARDVMHEGRPLPNVTTSVGLASYPDHGVSPESLLIQADRALYQAKSNGRNQVVVASCE